MASQAKMQGRRKAGEAAARVRYENGGRVKGRIAHLSCEQRAAQRLREWARERRMAMSAALGAVINGYLDGLDRDGEPVGPASRVD